MERIIVVVPFRIKSNRFPNKVSARFQGKPLIAHSLEIANAISEKVVLTSTAEDYSEIEPLIKDYNYSFIESSEKCNSGTDRVIEIRDRLMIDESFKIVVLPVDEPTINPNEIKHVLAQYKSDNCGALYCEFYTVEDASSELSAKMVIDSNSVIWNSKLLYMSRAPIPSNKKGKLDIWRSKKNVGVSFFTKKTLSLLHEKFWDYTSLDKIEGLEHLRWLELGFTVEAFKINHIGFGIDCPEQIELLENRVKGLDKEAHNQKLLIDINSMVEMLASRDNHIYIPIDIKNYKSWNATRKKENQHIRLDLIDVKDKTVLDLGCNTGYLSFQYLKRGAKHCIGLDFSSAAIEIARKVVEIENLSNIEFHRWDIGDFETDKPTAKHKVSGEWFRYNPKEHIFDVITLLSIHDTKWLLSIMPFIVKLGKTFYIEPTNHHGPTALPGIGSKRRATVEEMKEWGLSNLSQWGQVEYIGTTDYQNRGLFKLET